MMEVEITIKDARHESAAVELAEELAGDRWTPLLKNTRRRHVELTRLGGRVRCYMEIGVDCEFVLQEKL